VSFLTFPSLFPGWRYLFQISCGRLCRDGNANLRGTKIPRGKEALKKTPPSSLEVPRILSESLAGRFQKRSKTIRGNSGTCTEERIQCPQIRRGLHGIRKVSFGFKGAESHGIRRKGPPIRSLWAFIDKDPKEIKGGSYLIGNRVNLGYVDQKNVGWGHPSTLLPAKRDASLGGGNTPSLTFYGSGLTRSF